jgi:hypothetical protein
MPYIRVVYKTNKFDYVSSDLLDALITMERITKFYRASEERWINVRFDPIRGRGRKYQGPDRRRVAKSKEQEAEKGFIKAKRRIRNGEKPY